MTDLVLIDTSAWIEFLRKPGRADPAVAEEVQKVIVDDRAATTEHVLVEVAMGARGEKQLEQWRRMFLDLRLFPVDRKIWLAAAEHGYMLARKGLGGVPLADLLLSSLALEYGLVVLHKEERHLPKIAKLLGFSEYTP